MAKKRKNTITGIEIGRNTICSAQCLMGNNVVSNISIQPMEQNGGDYWDNVLNSFKELVDYPGIKLKGESIIASLPGEYAIIRKACVDRDEEDIQEAMEWEFSQQIIDSREEYLFDYQEVNSNSGGLQRYFLVTGYRKETVDKYTGILRKFKLNPLVIDLDLFALVNVFEANYSDSFDKAALIVLCQDDKIKMVLSFGGEFVDYEILEDVPSEQSAEDFRMNVEKCVSNIMSSNPGIARGDKPRLYLTGPAVSDADFRIQLTDNMDNAELLYPFREVSCSAGMKEDDLKKYSPQLAVAVGLALRGAGEIS